MSGGSNTSGNFPEWREIWPKEYASRMPVDTSKLPKGVCWSCTVMGLPGDRKHPMHRCRFILGKEVVPK